MAKQKYTVEQFTAFLHKFPADVQRIALQEWGKQTAEILGDAKNRTPLVTGNLDDSGAELKARITDKGIVSGIIFRAPYAAVIESGMRNGKPIKLRPVGYEYPHHTKSRLGEIGFLSHAGDAGADGLVQAMSDAIDKAWNAG